MMDRDPPDSSSDGQRRDLRAARLLGEYVDRVSQGETANVEEFLRGHPDISPEIEGELRLLVSLGTGAGEPRRFGDFEILREIGRGGMGIVYQARQVSLNRRVALKILPAALISDPRAVARFYREAKVAAILHHPNIVPVHAMGVESGTPFFVMELCEGETLRQALRRVSGLSEADGSASMATLLFGPAKGAPHSPVQTHFTPRSPSLLSQADEPCSPTPTKGDASGSTEQTYCVEVAGLFAGVAEGLQHAHDRKVIHRDLKPSNLILDLDGRLRILDFGLAWVADDQSLTLSSDRLGTPLYMSPEQARGDKDALGFATDIYSLGATLYEVLTWHPPCNGSDHR